MTAMPIDGRPTWPSEPLYQLVFEALPSWHTTSGILDVPRLADELEITDESIYKWFRRGTLPPRRCRQLHELAMRESGSVAPSLEAFYQFSG